MGIAVTYWKQENVWGGEITCVGGILAVLWWIPKFLQKKQHSNCTVMYTTNDQSHILGIHYLGKKFLLTNMLLHVNCKSTR